MSEGSKPYRALRHAEFRRFWIAHFVSLTGSQMQAAAIDWHVYLLTRSPLALGTVGLSRVVAISVFSLWGGVLADRVDRRRILLVSQTAMLLVAGALATLTATGSEHVAFLYLLTAVNSTAGSFDNPARQALIPKLVPRVELPGALSLNLTMFHAAMIVGPALAGLLIAGSAAVNPSEAGGLAAIYAINAVSFLTVIGVLLAMKISGKPEGDAATRAHPVRALQDGLRFVFGTPIIVATMALDFAATFFSAATSLLPIFADKVLHVGPTGFGWLRAAPALGAVVGSAWTSLRPLPRRQGPVFLWAVVVFGVATIVFGLSRSYALTFAALAITGLADVISTVVRQTIRQLVTPDALRGRMTSVNMLFFMGGPQLGEFEAGLVASFFASVALGATVSVVSGGIATILITAWVAWKAPFLRSYSLE